MGPYSELLAWWNLVFLLPIGLSALLLLATAAGGLGEGEGHAHADVQGDVHGHEWLHDAFAWAGVGVVPVSILLQAYLLFFGIVGLAVNRALQTATRPDSLIWSALALAAIGGLAGAGVLGAVGKRFMPKELPALGNKDLVGRDGQVVFEVTQTTGTAQVRDAGGTLHQIPARVPSGYEPLEAGRRVLVSAYDGQAGVFVVEDSPFALTQEDLRQRAS